MQPLQYDAPCPAAKDKSIRHAAAPPSNLDAAITMRDFPQNLKVEDVRTKLSRETSLKKWKWQM